MSRQATVTGARFVRFAYAAIFFVVAVAAFAVVSIYGYTIVLALRQLVFGS